MGDGMHLPTAQLACYLQMVKSHAFPRLCGGPLLLVSHSQTAPPPHPPG